MQSFAPHVLLCTVAILAVVLAGPPRIEFKTTVRTQSAQSPLNSQEDADMHDMDVGDPTPFGDLLVNVPWGKFQGHYIHVRDTKVARWRGFPLGQIVRLGKPIAWPNSNATYQSDTPSKACWQLSPDADHNSFRIPESEQDEQCLQAEIYSTCRPGQKCPVAIIQYAGSGVGGWNVKYNFTANMFDLARKRYGNKFKGFVLVITNYRLGGHHIPSTPAGDAVTPGGESGGYGFYDLEFALDFVQAYIHKFGGDKDGVMKWGHSTGGTWDIGLEGMPSTAGKYRAVMAMSPSPNITMRGPQVQAQQAERFLPFVEGCEGLTGAAQWTCLQNVPARALAAALHNPVTTFEFGVPYSQIYRTMLKSYDGYPPFPTPFGGPNNQSGSAVAYGALKKTLPEALANPDRTSTLYLSSMECEAEFVPWFPLYECMTENPNDWGQCLTTFFVARPGLAEFFLSKFGHLSPRHAFARIYSYVGFNFGLDVIGRLAVEGARANNVDRDVYVSRVNQIPNPAIPLSESGTGFPSTVCAPHGYDVMLMFDLPHHPFDFAAGGDKEFSTEERKLQDDLIDEFLHLLFYGNLDKLDNAPRFDESKKWPAVAFTLVHDNGKRKAKRNFERDITDGLLALGFGFDDMIPNR